MSKTTAIVNQKDGIGKTTTALNLGYALSEKGKKVLLIDFDPQASLSSALGINADNKANIYTLMTDAIEENETEARIINVKNNLDIIPSTLDLAGIEMTLVNVMSRETILKSITDEIKKDYDYVLIDCSPSLGTLTVNALAACDSVIIPVTPEYLSAKGLGLLVKNINLIKKRIDLNIEIDGILITMLNRRTNLSKGMVKAINESTGYIKKQYNLDIKVFESMIPSSVKAGEAMLIVTETNLIQRSFTELSHSEKVRILTERHNAIKEQGKRIDLINEIEKLSKSDGLEENSTSGQVGQKLESRNKIGNEYDLSGKTIARYLRIDTLIKELKDRLDNNKIPFIASVDFGYLIKILKAPAFT